MVIEACDGLCGKTNQTNHLFGFRVNRNYSSNAGAAPVVGYTMALEPRETTLGKISDERHQMLPGDKKLCKDCLTKYNEQCLSELIAQTSDKVSPPLLEAM